MSYLLDTNIISELVRSKPEKKVIEWFDHIPNDVLNISVLTLGEIRKGVEKLLDSHRKEKLRLWLEVELPAWFEGRILDINQFIADRWGRLQYTMKKPLPAIDSLIAATALYHDLRLVTRNKTDFKFPSLQVVCPWD
ncbi:MAG: type II toxin-antitoxin system VapC family toxin [Cellulomonas sp.]|nr:type II toxin-antitoxin system VapC family toxin [Rickettsiella sp.]